jgi:pyruvate dehydrogenase E2 component (dihydrolipoamide acetyltransferase)
VQEFKVPELGENVSQGDVAKILVKVGDTIARDQPVIELETDKATIEVPSSVAGVVKDIKVKQGDKVQVGAVILTVDENGAGGAQEPEEKQAGTATAQPAEAEQQAEAEPAAAEPAEQAKEEPSSPKPAEKAKAQAASPKPAEQATAADQKVVAMPRRESFPQPAPPQAPASPKPAEQAKAGPGSPKPAEQVKTGPGSPKPAEQAKAGPGSPKPAEQAKAGPGSPKPAEQAKAAEPQAAPPSRPSDALAAPAAPSVRRLAREIGVDINEVHGSGQDARISQEDVKEHARRILSSVGTTQARGTGQPAAAVPLPNFEKWGEVDRQPMSNIRRKTAEHLSHAWNTIPHVTQFDKADITPMEELRAKFKAQVEEAGGKLTVTAVLVKVLAAAVKQFPQFNASLDAEHNAIIYKKYVNVGVATDTEYGLLVPVIRNADHKNITEIAVEMQQLSEKARAKKLSLDEMSGGGMSISNLGGIGGTYFTPIVNWPEVAILGVSRGVTESVWRGSAFEPRQMLPLSLSYDHRVIDGADAMRFLRWVVEAIEQPFLLSLLG